MLAVSAERCPGSDPLSAGGGQVAVLASRGGALPGLGRALGDPLAQVLGAPHGGATDLPATLAHLLPRAPGAGDELLALRGPELAAPLPAGLDHHEPDHPGAKGEAEQHDEDESEHGSSLPRSRPSDERWTGVSPAKTPIREQSHTGGR